MTEPRVLHLYPHDDDMTAQYVAMLARHMGQQTLSEPQPDIVHLHACWPKRLPAGARIVFSPHGVLQPWNPAPPVGRQQVRRAYALVARGQMEADNLSRLDWNPRIETVRNPIITATVSEQEVCHQLSAIYRKVMDSDPLQLMAQPTRDMLPLLLKAGITGHRQAVLGVPDAPSLPTGADWRQIAVYARHEGVADLVSRGIEVLGLDAPLPDATAIPVYLPRDYSQPQPVSELMACIESLRRRPTLRHVADLHAALRQDDVEDDRLAEALAQRNLLKFARRLMAVLRDTTLLDEGYMPFAPLDDRGTQRIKNLITRNLRL